MVLPHALQRFAPGTRGDHSMPRAGQDLGQCVANFRLVIDDEYRAPARSRLPRRFGVGAGRFHSADGKQNREHRSPFDRTIDRERAAVGLHDAETHRQPDTGAHPCGLGREIRLEHPRAQMCRNARPVVCDPDAEHLGKRIETAAHAYSTRCGLVLQRLLGVDDQVEQHLMELVGIGEYERHSLGELELDIDAARANGVGGDVERCRHDVVDRHGTTFGLLLPRHGKEGSHDARTTLGGGANLQRCGLGRRIALFFEQYGARHDHGKRIVELVGDAGQERTERSELFSLIQRFALPREFFRGALLFGDVASDGQNVALSLILHRNPMDLELQRGAILAKIGHLRMKRLPGGDCFQEFGVVARAGVAGQRQCRRLTVAITVHSPQGRVGIHDLACGVP